MNFRIQTENYSINLNEKNINTIKFQSTTCEEISDPEMEGFNTEGEFTYFYISLKEPMDESKKTMFNQLIGVLDNETLVLAEITYKDLNGKVFFFPQGPFKQRTMLANGIFKFQIINADYFESFNEDMNNDFSGTNINPMHTKDNQEIIELDF